MSPTTLNWTIFAVSFTAFGALVVAWLRSRIGGGNDGDRARVHPGREGSPGGHSYPTPYERSRGVEPVSGAPLDMSTALPWFHRGTIYFFATEESRARFVARTTAAVSSRYREECR